MKWKTFPLRLQWSAKITPSILHLAFEAVDAPTLKYTAGQFINIHFKVDGEPTHRSYSVATAPETADLIEIAVSPVEGGAATDYLFGLDPGDRISASGPYGRFCLREETPKRYVLIATGTGVTPYRAMLGEIAKRLKEQPELEVLLILGVRGPRECLYGEEFRQFAAAHERFHFNACYSRDMPEDSSEHEFKGYVTERYKGLDFDHENDIVYLCGNPNMVDASVDYFKELGFVTKNIRREKYVSAKT